MITRFFHLAVDETGATLFEYAIVVSLIAAVCIGVVGTFGARVLSLFTTISARFGAS